MFSKPVYLRCTLVLCGVSLLSACDRHIPEPLVIEGKTMGTFYRVSLAGVDKNREPALREQIEAQLKEDDHQLSTYKDDSVLSRFNQYQVAQVLPATDLPTYSCGFTGEFNHLER